MSATFADYRADGDVVGQITLPELLGRYGAHHAVDEESMMRAILEAARPHMQGEMGNPITTPCFEAAEALSAVMVANQDRKALSAQPSPGGQGVLETVEELAELNRACAALDPDNKTLADVQPGGRVRLGDQAELDRLEFQAWARWFVAPVERDEAGDYVSDFTRGLWCAWQAALAARQPVCGTCDEAIQPDAMTGTKCACSRVPLASIQPSGNSGELAVDTQPVGPEEVWVTIVDGEAVDASNTKCSMTGLPDGYEVVRFVRAAVAARQPVGEPVAYRSRYIERDGRRGIWMYHHEKPEYASDVELQTLYAAPPTQAVDLGGMLTTLETGARLADFEGYKDTAEELRDIAKWLNGVYGKAAVPTQADTGIPASPAQPWQLQLADALECAWNPALQSDHDGLGPGSAMAQGLAAVAARLREHAAGEVKP